MQFYVNGQTFHDLCFFVPDGSKSAGSTGFYCYGTLVNAFALESLGKPVLSGILI